VFIGPLFLLSFVQVTVFGRSVAVLSEFEKMIQAAGEAQHTFIYLFIFLSFPFFFFFFFFFIYIHTHKLPKSDTQLINKTPIISIWLCQQNTHLQVSSVNLMVVVSQTSNSIKEPTLFRLEANCSCYYGLLNSVTI
jgi:hypothetical protein